MGEGLGVRATDGLQFLMLRRGVNDERREKLFQHVTVFLEQQAEELPHVMAHDVHLQPFDDARILDRFIADLQADDLFERQHMRAAQVKVRVQGVTPGEERIPEDPIVPMPSDGTGCCSAVAAWLETKGPLGKLAAIVVRFICRLLGQLTT